MYKGQRYRVTCTELRAMIYTKEASGKLANAWWEKKVAELKGPSPVAQVLQAVDEMPLHKLRELMERGDAVKRILAELPFVKADFAPEEVGRIVGESVADEDEALGKISEVVGKIIEGGGAQTGRSLKHHGERFLALTCGTTGPMSYREVHDFVTSLYSATAAGLSEEMDIGELNEEKVEGVYLWLKEASLTTPTKKKRWGFFKRLVRYCWEARAIDLPRNLDSRALRFKVQPKAVRTWTPQEVRKVLKKLKKPQLRLYALLGLNCGMTNVDIGYLRKDQVDLAAGRLVRKRVKTQDHEQVPTVDYPLWPRTVALLKECWSDHEDFALASSDGTALYSSRFEGDKTRKTDLLALAWKRAKVTITLKAFRSISATLIEAHASYGRYKGHFLGHSPKSVADRHYAAPSKELFDEIICWLEEQIFES
jgi:integrase